MTLTKVAKLALKSGTPPDVLIDAAIDAKYTRQGAHAALREAGYRKRGLRSDKGLTLRRKLDRLVQQAKALQEKLGSSREPDANSPAHPNAG